MIEISVCIPIFNFDIKPLLNALVTEIETFGLAAEIIMIDDASDKEVAKLNERSAKEYSLQYIPLQKNIGRSAIRNLFVQYAQAEQLLFLDCDVMPQSKRFIQHYLAKAGDGIVICGGICYGDCPDKLKKLHWKYGSRREAMPADKRNLDSYHHFLTGNFLVPKKILRQVKFNEDLKSYGHEDTLFAIELERNKIELKHINLPVQHLKLDTSADFISKTENATQNLFFLYQMEQYKNLLPRYVSLVKVYEFLKKAGLNGVIFMGNKTRKKIRNSLIEGNKNLRLLDFYKLLFFISLVKKSSN